jgi:hypothetical protein
MALYKNIEISSEKFFGVFVCKKSPVFIIILNFSEFEQYVTICYQGRRYRGWGGGGGGVTPNNSKRWSKLVKMELIFA